MHLAVQLVVVATVILAWVRVCVELDTWQRARQDQRAHARTGRSAGWSARLRRRPRGRALPHVHRPPPGLGPHSPSERFLTQEAARGLRDLQLFLLDQRTA